jgi:hypothetical protein
MFVNPEVLEPKESPTSARLSAADRAALFAAYEEASEKARQLRRQLVAAVQAHSSDLTRS